MIKLEKYKENDDKFKTISIKIYNLCNNSENNIWTILGIETFNFFKKNIKINIYFTIWFF